VKKRKPFCGGKSFATPTSPLHPCCPDLPRHPADSEESREAARVDERGHSYAQDPRAREEENDRDCACAKAKRGSDVSAGLQARRHVGVPRLDDLSRLGRGGALSGMLGVPPKVALTISAMLPRVPSTLVVSMGNIKTC
jgi:hypothetical protein